jgi:hypothetical protein
MRKDGGYKALCGVLVIVTRVMKERVVVTELARAVE